MDQKPKAGSLQLNCSLRDYKTSILDHTKAIIVDDWEEVCREKTDIEMMHMERGLQEKDTKSIVDVVCHNAMAGLSEGRCRSCSTRWAWPCSTSRPAGTTWTRPRRMKIGLELE